MHAMLSLDFNHDLNREADAISQPGIKAGTRGLRVINMKTATPCNQVHVRQVDESILTNLAEHQMHVKGVRKCCQCAYNSGYQQGALLQKFISLDIESLGDSHASADGHYKSIHQAFALGYSDGVNSFILS
ncbi:hypothetical protein CXF85_00630 [Colwellia sp. 75C3]|uniref:hypothetical protein n=1 Tax=Colwellia sp. 75C3 TaxID=888425 RepID=UPI000C33EE49|nr:hypothetical protein [Colwellia sp. 75C3]PKG86251.1 hypothetical protein CXF85_00630 [Colwellia sp. 75C3]